MKKIFSKNAEITMKQIVVMIVLIISFAVILYFIVQLNLGEESTKEICHNSVVLKGSSVAGEITSLNCKRTYLCLTQGDDCVEEGMPDATRIEKVSNKKEFFGILAEEMADCWWMYGEGEINYIGGIEIQKKLYCSICSQVAFDESIKELFEGKNTFSQKEIYDYLYSTKMPGKEINYSDYLFSAAKKPSNFRNVNLNEQYFILMGILPEKNRNAWLSIVSASPLVSATAGVVGSLLFPNDTADFIGFLIKGDKLETYRVSILNSEDYKKLNCYDVV